MAEPAAKEGDEISSDGTSWVWVQPPPPPPDPSSPPPKCVHFTYKGPIDDKCSPDVLIKGRLAATENSTATNSKPPNNQPAVTSEGEVITPDVNNTSTILSGSSTVYINGKKAARNGDVAETFDYSEGPPGKPAKLKNAKVVATGSVYIGG